MGVSFAPAKRAAVAAPQARAGPLPAALPEPLAPGRRTEDLPLLALPACLSTLETKLWPRFFGALGRMRKSSSRRSVMAALLQALACPVVRSTRTCLHWRGPAPQAARRRSLRAATPCADWLSMRPGAASCLAFRLCPSLPLRASAALCCTAASPPANAQMDKPGAAGRARSRQDACTSDGCAEGGANARALHARRHADEQQADTPDGTTRGTAACSESTAIMGVSPSRPDAQRRSRRMR